MRIVLALVAVALLIAGYFWLVLTWNYSTGERAGWIQKLSKKGTDASVTHVVARPPKPAVETVAARRQTNPGVLGPLSVLAWGGHKER